MKRCCECLHLYKESENNWRCIRLVRKGENILLGKPGRLEPLNILCETERKLGWLLAWMIDDCGTRGRYFEYNPNWDAKQLP
jgi:hypothetical protein